MTMSIKMQRNSMVEFSQSPDYPIPSIPNASSQSRILYLRVLCSKQGDYLDPNYCQYDDRSGQYNIDTNINNFLNAIRNNELNGTTIPNKLFDIPSTGPEIEYNSFVVFLLPFSGPAQFANSKIRTSSNITPASASIYFNLFLASDEI